MATLISKKMMEVLFQLKEKGKLPIDSGSGRGVNPNQAKLIVRYGWATRELKRHDENDGHVWMPSTDGTTGAFLVITAAGRSQVKAITDFCESILE